MAQYIFIKKTQKRKAKDKSTKRKTREQTNKQTKQEKKQRRYPPSQAIFSKRFFTSSLPVSISRISFAFASTNHPISAIILYHR